MRPLAARCHLGLARLARDVGDTGGAEKHLAAAREGFEAMRMTYWLERIGIEPGGLSVGGPPEI
jgi:hypothetical protein